MDLSEQMIFRGYDCCEKFLNWIFDYPITKRTSRLFIAHNLGSYDGFLLLKHMYHLRNPPQLLIRNQRILQMTLKQINVTFKDSLNFIQLPLSAFKKAFDLKVGKFDAVPLRLNTEKYLNDASLIPRGTIPDLEAFLLDGFSKEKIESIRIWHSKESELYKQQDLQYNVASIIEEYCKSDVLTLLKGLNRFRFDFALFGCKEKRLDVLWAVRLYFKICFNC